MVWAGRCAHAGALLAVLGAVFSRGYVHPDEFFQSVEIAARDVLGYRVFVPWEWGGALDGTQLAPRDFGDCVPCRSAAFAFLAAHAPIR